VALICWLKLLTFLCPAQQIPLAVVGGIYFGTRIRKRWRCTSLQHQASWSAQNTRAVQSSLWHGQCSVLHFADSCLRCIRTEHSHRSAAHSGRQSCLSQYIFLLICIAIWQCKCAVQCAGTSYAETMRLYCGGIINNIDWNPFTLWKKSWVWFEDSRHFWSRCYIHVRLPFVSPEAVAVRCIIKCYIVPEWLREQCPRARGSTVVMNFAATNGTQGLLLLLVLTAYRTGPNPEPYETPCTPVSYVCKVQFNVMPF
jgi:hypothetical protein